MIIWSPLETPWSPAQWTVQWIVSSAPGQTGPLTSVSVDLEAGLVTSLGLDTLWSRPQPLGGPAPPP